MLYSDYIKKGVQTRFDGLNHNPGAGDGELFCMENMTGDYYPLLSTRRKRRVVKRLPIHDEQTIGPTRYFYAPNGLFAYGKLCWVDYNNFYYDNELKKGDWNPNFGGYLDNREKTFAALNRKILIMPDKVYYDLADDKLHRIETLSSALKATVSGGNTITLDITGPTAWTAEYNVGDVVTISGFTGTLAPDNGDRIIRGKTATELSFDDDSLVNGSQEDRMPKIKIQRKCPDMDYMCEAGNRLWGCKGDTIYCTALGDIFNWYRYDGLDTDSWAVDTGTAGDFTGCINYLGYPTFFKEDRIFKVYGNLPSNFQLMATATLGVAPGSGKSLAIAGDVLFYLSTSGFMAYTGSMPQPVGEAFGDIRFTAATSGSDGLKYYTSALDQDGEYSLLVYDPRRGTWHREDNTHVISFCRLAGNTYYLDDEGYITVTGNILENTVPDYGDEDAGLEEDFDWYAEFSDFTEGSPNKKGVSKLLIRLEPDDGAFVRVYLRFDSAGGWTQAGETAVSGVKRSVYLPIIPRRGDHYRLRIEGTGGCKVYSIAREYYEGSELRSR